MLVINMGLLSTDFVFHLVTRVTLFATVMSIGVIASSNNEETDILRSAFLHFAGIIIFEFIFYV